VCFDWYDIRIFWFVQIFSTRYFSQCSGSYTPIQNKIKIKNSSVRRNIFLSHWTHFPHKKFYEVIKFYGSVLIKPRPVFHLFVFSGHTFLFSIIRESFCATGVPRFYSLIIERRADRVFAYRILDFQPKMLSCAVYKVGGTAEENKIEKENKSAK